MSVDQAIVMVLFRAGGRRGFGLTAAFPAGPAMVMDQAVIVFAFHVSVLSCSMGPAQWVASWNCAASVLWAMAVVLACPPLAAMATASK